MYSAKNVHLHTLLINKKSNVILNFFYLRYLPNAMRTKQTKTVLILRNPKDAAVSHYNHCKGIKIYDYDGEWKNFFPLWIQGKRKYIYIHNNVCSNGNILLDNSQFEQEHTGRGLL